MKTVTLYTDGACSGNPGPGGWGAILMYGAHRRELSGGDKARMLRFQNKYRSTVRTRPELVRRVMERLNREFPELVLSISIAHNLEINAPDATKGAALLALCRALDIDPSETVAFGDGTNDVTMVKAAGVGVAMANASPETLAAADLVAPSNEEDGVARVLEQWF